MIVSMSEINNNNQEDNNNSTVEAPVHEKQTTQPSTPITLSQSLKTSSITPIISKAKAVETIAFLSPLTEIYCSTTSSEETVEGHTCSPAIPDHLKWLMEEDHLNFLRKQPDPVLFAKQQKEYKETLLNVRIEDTLASLDSSKSGRVHFQECVAYYMEHKKLNHIFTQVQNCLQVDEKEVLQCIQTHVRESGKMTK